MFKKVSVYNFKSLHKVEHVNLSRVTLIGGKNNSGKSSLIEAIFLYLDRRNVDLLIRQLGWRGINNVPVDPDVIWAPFFYNYDLKKTISIATVDDFKQEGSLSLKYIPEYTSQTPLFQGNIAHLNNQTTTISKALQIKHVYNNLEDEKSNILIDARGMGMVKEKDNGNMNISAVFFPSRQRFDNDDADRLGKVDLKQSQEDVIGILRIFEPTLKRLISIKLGLHIVIHAELGNNKIVPVGLLGDGFCRALSIILAIATNPNGIVMVDEIENGIHYSMLESVWESLYIALKIFNSQIIATTHSYELIKSAVKQSFESNFTELSYVRLSKKEENTDIFQFSNDEIADALMSELEVR